MNLKWDQATDEQLLTIALVENCSPEYKQAATTEMKKRGYDV